MRKKDDIYGIKDVNEEKDLGVWITADLICRKQCAASASKAAVVLRALKNCFR